MFANLPFSNFAVDFVAKLKKRNVTKEIKSST